MADPNPTPALKSCCTCKSALSTDCFYKDARKKDGLYARCKLCHNAATSRWGKENKAATAAMARDWRAKNKDAVTATQRRAYQKKAAASPEYFQARVRAYRGKHPEVVLATKRKSVLKVKALRGDEMSRWHAEYYERNAAEIKKRSEDRYWRTKIASRPTVAERVMRRNAKKLHATPSWANLDAMRQIYERCAQVTRETGVIHQVDHIVPLQSKHVCGLHVEANLQVLPRADNAKKSNRWWPNCPDHVLARLPGELLLPKLLAAHAQASEHAL